MHFDGSASPNPGDGGAAAVATIKVTTTRETKRIKQEWSAALGHVTNIAAEYHALILGLRSLLSYLRTSNIRHEYVKLSVRGDSETVINHVKGTYRVSNPFLKPLYVLVLHLSSRFQNVSFVACPRTSNAAADRLAKQARQRGPTALGKAIYYPALLTFVRAWICGEPTLASHDMGTAGSDPSCFIDANYLLSLPGGNAIYANMHDPAPLSAVVAKTNMTVLGSVTLPVQLSWAPESSIDEDGPEPDGLPVLIEFVVVDFLPVPLHLSVRHPSVPEPSEHRVQGMVSFKRDCLPELYEQHRYWESEVAFFGIEDPDLINSGAILSGRELFRAGGEDLINF